MEEIFMLRQLIIKKQMIELNNKTKSEKYQQDKGMIIQLVVYWILLISQTITN